MLLHAGGISVGLINSVCCSFWMYDGKPLSGTVWLSWVVFPIDEFNDQWKFFWEIGIGCWMRIDKTVRFLELGGVWKYQRNYHLISYRLSFNVLSEIADAKNLHSHFLFLFFFFQKVERGFQFFNTQLLKNILQKYMIRERFCWIKLFEDCSKNHCCYVVIAATFDLFNFYLL